MQVGRLPARDCGGMGRGGKGGSKEDGVLALPGFHHAASTPSAFHARC